MSDERKRRPPAYQVYAADDLAGSRYYPLSAGERGVLDSMLRACWVDDTVPSDPGHLALALRLQETDLRGFLTPRVLQHFEQDGADPKRLRSRELTRQMANLMEVRERQRQGGREGAKITNSSRTKWSRPEDGNGSGPMGRLPATPPAGRLAGPEVSGDDVRGGEQRRDMREDRSLLNPEQAEWRRSFIEAEQAGEAK